MSSDGVRPARIPAPRRPPRGDAVFASPWFGPPRLNGRPWILTFVGTDESFVDVFFRGLKTSGDRFVQGAFPKLLPVRDFAEPPRALIDGSGAPAYVRAHVELPAGEQPGGDEIELDGLPAGATLADALEDAGMEQALPPPSDPNHAAWLRKLYLPMHCHFHLVACELVCDRPALPRIDPKRVTEAGMVVRRFIPDSKATQPRWEDWIPSPYGNGIWAEIADEEMKTLHGGARIVDPAALPGGVFGPAEIEIYQRLGLNGAPEVPLGLGTIPIDPLPVTVGESKKHTTRWGFLSISSLEKERQRLDPSDDASEIAKALADAAVRHLDERVVGRATQIRQRVRDALLPLLKLFRNDLPNRPASTNVTDAYTKIAASSGATSQQIDDGALKLGMATLAYYADWLLKVPDKNSRWADRLNLVCLLVVHGPSQSPPQSPPANLPAWTSAIAAQPPSSPLRASLSDVVLEAVWRVVVKALSPQNVLSDDIDSRLLTALLLWIRRHRVGLLQAFYEVAFAPPTTPPDPDEVPTPGLATPGKRPVPVGPLGAELEGWLAANSAESREEQPVPWPPPALSAVGLHVHGLALTLETTLVDVDAQGAGAGAGYAELLDEEAKKTSGNLSAQLGSPEVRMRGIDVFAQPDRGLLVFPGPSPTAASLAALRDLVQTHYLNKAIPGHAEEAPDDLRNQGKALREVIRPRYDHDSLYAVFCYAKVLGTDPCEQPQIVWSRRTEVFFSAEPMDLLGLKPISIRLPDLPKLIRDIPRMRKARALPFAAVTTPQNSGIKTGEEAKETAREWGIAWICSFGIPVFTLVAWVLFYLIFSILILIPGFAWMLLLKFCIPVPAPKKS